uniref:Putative odorant-binding protein 16 n=1 Tax=Anthonomus grandis TaxID=7044 RepID=A0A2P9JZF4_ANTGR|nr:putative odorant-binding protein 16 [Anthonomus grandis]
MKGIVVFVLVAVVACKSAGLTDEQKAKVQVYGKECVTDTGVDPELIKKARAGSFADDAKLKAFTFCMSTKIGFQNDAGDIQADVIKEKLSSAISAEVADMLIERCLKKLDTNEDTAYEVFKCYYENTPEHLAIF